MSEAVEIVRASAGSGKTYLLAVEYIAAAISRKEAFKNILAVTFTNKATSEMKGRIIEQLWLLSMGKDESFLKSVIEKTGMDELTIKANSKRTLDEILRDYSSFSVLTIDKFFQRIVRSFFKELGLDLSYEVLIDTSAAVEMAVDGVMAASKSDQAISRQISAIVDKMLDDNKKVDVKSELTRMLNSALNNEEDGELYDNSNNSSILALEQEFNELKKKYLQTKGELIGICHRVGELIYDNGLDFSDFKGSSRSFMWYFKKVADSETLSEYTPTFAKAATESDDKNFATAKQFTTSNLRSILPQIINLTRDYKEKFDSTLVQRTTFEVLNKNFLLFVLLYNLKTEFHKILSQNSEISINRTTQLVRSIASEVQVPFIFEKLGSKYSTIFIDEFQDTSINQWEGFFPLIEEAAAQAHQKCVMLIGDIKQAIYRFRGGDWRLIGGAAERQLSGMVMKTPTLLNTSWRSESVIVNFNNLVMRKVTNYATEYVDDFVGDLTDSGEIESIERSFTKELKEILPNAYADMEQKISPKKIDDYKGYVELVCRAKDETLLWVCESVKSLIERGCKPSSIAVLVRTGSQGAEIANEMLNQGVNFISDEVLKIGASQVVKFIISMLTMAVNGEDSITRAFVNHYRGFPFEQELNEEEKELLITLRSKNSLEAMDLVVRYFELSNTESYFILSLSDLIYNFAQKAGYDLRLFVESWHNGGLNEKPIVLPNNDKAVRILTIHKSKGLEFEAVILPFASWAVFPGIRTTIYANTNDIEYNSFNGIPLPYTKSLENTCFRMQYLDEGVSSAVDNINLLYVALTRAKSELYIGMATGSKSRNVAKILQDIVDSEGFESVGDEDDKCYVFGTPLEFEVSDSKNKLSRSECNDDEEEGLVHLESYISYSAPELRYESGEND